MIEAPDTAADALSLALRLFENADKLIRAALSGDATIDIPPSAAARAEGRETVAIDSVDAVEYARHLRETAIGYLEWARVRRSHEPGGRGTS